MNYVSTEDGGWNGDGGSISSKDFREKNPEKPRTARSSSGFLVPSESRHKLSQQVFWLSDQLELCSLPSEVGLESGWGFPLCRHPSPNTAAGPPRTFTVFRDAGKRRIF